MVKKKRALTPQIRVGIAASGADQARAAVRHRIDDELGTVVLAEVHSLPAEASFRPANARVLSEVAATTVEVLASHLSNYLGSEDQKGKVSAPEADFAGFIRQSIVGTESIAIDMALHAQGADGTIHHNIAKLQGKTKEDPSFGAVSLKETFPAIMCNLEVAVLYQGGAHIAHRGQSRQYLIKKDSVEQLTQDYNPGGLLSALDDLADFLPKVELKQIAMSPEDRLVIFSQGAFLKGPSIDPQSLQQGRHEAPEKHAAAIAKKVARNNVNPGFIIVIEFIDEKKEEQRQSRLGKSSTTQADPQKSKTSSSQGSLPANLGTTLSSYEGVRKVVETRPAADTERRVDASQTSTAVEQKSELPKPTFPPRPVAAGSIPEHKPEAPVSASKPGSLFDEGVVHSPKQRNAAYKELENSNLFSPDELVDLRRRMKARFERELRSFEQEMGQYLAQEMEGLGQRIASQFAAASPSVPDISRPPPSPLFSNASIPPPDDAAHAVQTIPSDRPAPATDLDVNRFSVEGFSPVPPPLPAGDGDRQREALRNAALDDDDDDGIPISPVGHRKKAALGQPTLIRKTAWTGALNKLKPWGAHLAIRLVGLNARLGYWTVRGRRPFARPWVAPVALGGLILLFVLTAAFLLKPPPPLDFVRSDVGVWAEFVSTAKSTYADHAQSLSSVHQHLRFFPHQPPEDRKDAWGMGRQLYLDCNNRRIERRDRLGQNECIGALLSAIRYLDYAIEPDAQDRVVFPDIWYVIARTHFHLARLGHERRKNAEAALAAYKKYLAEVSLPTEAKQQAIDFDNKLITKWLWQTRRGARN